MVSPYSNENHSLQGDINNVPALICPDCSGVATLVGYAQNKKVWICKSCNTMWRGDEGDMPTRYAGYYNSIVYEDKAIEGLDRLRQIVDELCEMYNDLKKEFEEYKELHPPYASKSNAALINKIQNFQLIKRKEHKGLPSLLGSKKFSEMIDYTDIRPKGEPVNEPSKQVPSYDWNGQPITPIGEEPEWKWE
jgi:hypothetical protein